MPLFRFGANGILEFFMEDVDADGVLADSGCVMNGVDIVQHGQQRRLAGCAGRSHCRSEMTCQTYSRCPRYSAKKSIRYVQHLLLYLM